MISQHDKTQYGQNNTVKPKLEFRLAPKASQQLKKKLWVIRDYTRLQMSDQLNIEL